MREGGEGGVVADEEREIVFLEAESCWCWMYLGVKGKGRKRDDRLPAPAVTQKICLPPPVREGGKGTYRQRDILLYYFFYDFWVGFFFLFTVCFHSLCSLLPLWLTKQTDVT